MSSLMTGSAMDDAIRDPYQDVTIKVGPPKTAASGGGTTGAEQPMTANPSGASAPLGYGLNGMSVVPEAQRLKKNPQLVSTPSTVQQDDLYAAALAQARHQLNQQYLAALRDIGFVDDKGNFIPGLLETEAARRRSSINKQMGLAEEGVNNEALRNGAFFSGRRATNLSNTRDPFLRDLTNLETDLPRMITDRYNDIQNLLSGFTLTQDQLLAELSGRNATRAQNQPSGPINIPATPEVIYDPRLGANTVRAPGAGRHVEM